MVCKVLCPNIVNISVNIHEGKLDRRAQNPIALIKAYPCCNAEPSCNPERRRGDIDNLMDTQDISKPQYEGTWPVALT